MPLRTALNGGPDAVLRPRRAANRLEATDLHSCVGIGDNLLRAKIAGEFARPPDGPALLTLTAQNRDAVMAERPTRAPWGVGPKTAHKLTYRAIRTVAELSATDPAALAAALGPSLGGDVPGRVGSAVQHS